MKVEITSYRKIRDSFFPFSSYFIFDVLFCKDYFNQQEDEQHFVKSIHLRYSEFLSLHESISKINSSLEFPKKIFFKTESQIKKRMLALQNYLNSLFLLKDEEIQKILYNFFLNKTKSSFQNTFIPITSIKNPISDLLSSLAKEPHNFSSILKQFEEQYEPFSPESDFETEEIYELFFGNNEYKGLISYINTPSINFISACSALSFISRSIDCEYNPNYHQYKKVFQVISLNKVLSMHITSFIIANNEIVLSKCFTIIKCLTENEEMKVNEILEYNNELIEKYQKWLEE